jgi:hypothetical protein
MLLNESACAQEGCNLGQVPCTGGALVLGCDISDDGQTAKEALHYKTCGICCNKMRQTIDCKVHASFCKITIRFCRYG